MNHFDFAAQCPRTSAKHHKFYRMRRNIATQWSHRVYRQLHTHSGHITGGETNNLFNIDSRIFATNDKTKFSGHVSSNWSVGDAPNGGYLMAMAISAARNVIHFRDPLSMTAYYLNKAAENQPVDIEVKTLNATKGSASVSVSFSQQGVLRSQYIGTFGSLDKNKGLNYNNMRPAAPQLPPPEECFDCSAALRKSFGDNLKVASRVEFRAPHSDPFVKGTLHKQNDDTAVQEASLSCWVRFAEDKLPCLRSMSFFCDALPPPILRVAHTNWVPTLEYTVHFWQRADFSKRDAAVIARDKSAPYWLRCRYNTPIAINGMLYTDAELWSEDGTQLLATARQLAKVLTPR